MPAAAHAGMQSLSVLKNQSAASELSVKDAVILGIYSPQSLFFLIQPRGALAVGYTPSRFLAAQDRRQCPLKRRSNKKSERKPPPACRGGSEWIDTLTPGKGDTDDL